MEISDKYKQNNFQWLCLIYTFNFKNKYEHIITINTPIIFIQISVAIF